MNEHGSTVTSRTQPTNHPLVNPTTEARYWRENHSSRSFVPTAVFGYEEYAPAYRYGWERFARHDRPHDSFDIVEADLARGWDQARYGSRLAWEQAKHATREAWDRLNAAAHALVTPADHD